MDIRPGEAERELEAVTGRTTLNAARKLMRAKTELKRLTAGASA